jgi:hypothetical protein
VNQPPARTVEFYTDDEVVHVRVDAPGERAVSAPLPDVLQTIVDLAHAAGFEVDDTAQGELYISWPSG